jgi:hypothetical protein
MPTTLSAPRPPAPAICLTVFRLHWWDRHNNETSLFHSYDAALASLARTVRDALADRPETTTPAGALTDAQTVLAFYGGDSGEGGPDAPTCGESGDTGFEIVEDLVGGKEPGEVTLRLANLRVLDGDPDDPDVPAVTYCLDADGLTIAVRPGPDGYPYVLITPHDHLSGGPITVRLEDPLRPGGFEQTYRMS